MIIEDYTDLFFNKHGLGYQDIQKMNLKSYLPDLSLFLKDDFSFYINLEYIPWKTIDEVFYVAAVNKTKKLLSYLSDKYQSDFIILIASRKDIFRFIQLKFSDAILEKTKTDLYKTAPLYSAYNLLKAKHKNTICLSAFIIIMLIIIYPEKFLLGLVCVANIIFFVNSILRLLLILLTKKRYIAQDKAIKRLADEDCPIYTIILPSI